MIWTPSKTAIARGESPEIEDFDGRTPIIYAGIFGTADIIDYLAEAQVSLGPIRTSSGTPRCIMPLTGGMSMPSKR